MRTRILILILAVAGVSAAATITALAGSDSAESTGAAGARATLAVRGSDYGRILFDGRGRALYAFTRDPRAGTRCTGDCAEAWPPYVVHGMLRAGKGVDASLLRTIRRPDGSRQVTYAGKPLYYYVGDTGPGVVRCQNVFEFGGLWLVVRPSGRLVR
jgi:predicted lipoprotein with Yx(FWY)xxD motif